MSSLRNRLLVLCLCLAGGPLGWAQLPDSTLLLDQSVLVERRVKPMVQNQVGISGSVNTDKIHAVPSLMGYADPIRFMSLLPSVQLNTELEGNLHMQGNDNSHTLVSQAGVPIYGASHLMGFFSVFNTPHFKGMDYAASAGMESRLGGVVNLQLQDSVARRLGADVSLGMLSAQGTMDIPMGKSSLRLSARRTYINLIYGKALTYDGNPLNYGFTDANLTWTWRPSRNDRIQVDAFGSLDRGSFESGLIEKMEARWYNALGAIHWNHYYDDASLRQSWYVSASGLDPSFLFAGISGQMLSGIQDYGYKNAYLRGNWEFNTHLSYYRVQPQNPHSLGLYADSSNNGDIPLQHAFEAQLGAWYKWDLGFWLRLKAGLGANLFLSPEGRWYGGPTQEVKLTALLAQWGTLELAYGLRRQNLFQLGLTHIGLPCEFWFPAGDIQSPQRAHHFALSYNVDFCQGAWSLSSEAYYRILRNQLEYVGSLMDLYTGHYSLEGSVLKGKGWAYGFNFMLQRQKGPLTGWVSYAWSRSLRSFDAFQDGKEYPANHERIHELDLVLTYDGGRWDAGITYVLGSGTPYTRPESIYVVGSRMICQYGPYNGARLPAYMRADFSANWYFRRGPRGKSGVNFSMYNILGNENAVAYGIHFSKEHTAYSYKPFILGIRFMPSLSFFYSF